MFVQLKLIHEPRPGERWQRFWDRVWPLYRQFFLSEGIDARAGYTTSRSMLERHMPELMPSYERLCELSGGAT